MSGPPTDPVDAAIRIAERLEADGIPYAIGGALAYGLWAVPRATVDVDIDVFLARDALKPLFRALQELGIAFDPEDAERQNARDGMFVGRWGLYRIDIFTPSIEFEWEAHETRVRCELEGHSVWVLSAEAIAVLKLLFFRTKDIADLERLVAVHAELDRAYVRDHVARMMGEEDERLRLWDRITAPPGR